MTRHRIARAFTLIEILIVVVILGIIAALVVPKMSNAASQAGESAVRRQLQVVRSQIEYYRQETQADPDLLSNQWADLVAGDYLVNAPDNPINGLTNVAGAPGAGVGWVWVDPGNGRMTLYATDVTQVAYFVE